MGLFSAFKKKGKEHSAYKCTVRGSGLSGDGVLMSLFYSDDEVDPSQKVITYSHYTVPDTIEGRKVLGFLPRHSFALGFYSFSKNVVFIPLEGFTKRKSNGDMDLWSIKGFSDRGGRRWKIAFCKSTASTINVMPGEYVWAEGDTALFDLKLDADSTISLLEKLLSMDHAMVDGEKRPFGPYSYKLCLVPMDTNGFTINIDQWGLVYGVN